MYVGQQEPDIDISQFLELHQGCQLDVINYSTITSTSVNCFTYKFAFRNVKGMSVIIMTPELQFFKDKLGGQSGFWFWFCFFGLQFFDSTYYS